MAGGVSIALLQDVRWVALAFPALALLVPLEIQTGTAVSLNAAVVGVVGLIGLALVQHVFRPQFSLPSSRLHPPLLALLSVAGLSLLLGNVTWDLGVPRPAHLLLIQLGQLAIYVLSFLVFWFTGAVLSEEGWLRRLTYALVATGGLGAVLMLLSRVLAVRLPLDAVALNMVTVWVVPLSLAAALFDSELDRRHRSLLIGICGAVLVMVGWVWFVEGDWVGGWLPPFLALSLLLWFRYPRFRWLVLLAAVVIFLVVGVESFTHAFDYDLEQKWEISGEGRIALWVSVIELVVARPILGLGIAAYRHYHFVKPLAVGGALWIRPSVSAHNMFVDLFAQMGLLGLACYLWFLAAALLLAWRQYRRHTGFARGYALAAFCALVGIIAADIFAATSLPFVYNMSFAGFRASAVSWMLLGGLVVLDNRPGSDTAKPTAEAVPLDADENPALHPG